MPGILMLVLALQIAARPDPFVGLRAEWASDLHAKNIEESMALYEADADFISDAGRTHGTAAIRELYRKITATLDSDLTFTSKHVEVSGNLAVDSGSYTETLRTRATGATDHIAGEYVMVYRRDADGRWRILEQAWMGGK